MRFRRAGRRLYWTGDAGGASGGEPSSASGGDTSGMATDARHPAVSRGGSAAPVLPPKLLIGGGLLLVAIVYLVITSLQTSAVYYITVGELLARGTGAAGQTVRLAGEVVDGSIE